MKYLRILLVTSFIAAVYFLTSCGSTDTIPPKLYLYGASDTTILLGLQYVDRGIYVEDNASNEDEIEIENDIEDVINFYNDGKTRRTGDYYITYTATDQEGNSDTIGRMVRVKNVSTPFAGSYECRRQQSFFWNDTSYRSTVSADTRTAGRLRISRVYNHYDPSNNRNIFFTVYAELWHPELSQQFSSIYGYLGTVSDPESPFYADMDYDGAIDSIKNFTYLKIQGAPYLDSIGNAEFNIAGSNQNGIPLSRIEYINGEVSKIILKYVITKYDGSNPDQVIEEYIPY
ncbi:MAG: DUF5011 domain-containing protein [Bacteroidales bacterium]|jgi:hypothetical protein|nr:DUF5011 domain-containing protein [Bacteroidales bacterium]